MNRYRNQRNSDRAGFTLMELMLVMAILIMLAGMGIGAYMTIQQNALADSAQVRISSLEGFCKQFRLNTGRFPNTLQDLVSLPQNMTDRKWRGPYIENGEVPLDPWGNEYQYSKDEGKNQVFIRSNGQDGQANTADDIPERRGTRQ